MLVWTVVLEKTLESPLDCKEIKPDNPKRNQSWIFIGRTDAEAETPLLWPLNVKDQLTGKDPDAGKDWRWEKKGTTEDKMVGWHHGCEFVASRICVWVNSRSWWWTGRSSVLQSMGSQRVRHDWSTELNWENYTPFRKCIATQYNFTKDWSKNIFFNLRNSLNL